MWVSGNRADNIFLLCVEQWAMWYWHGKPIRGHHWVCLAFVYQLCSYLLNYLFPEFMAILYKPGIKMQQKKNLLRPDEQKSFRKRVVARFVEEGGLLKSYHARGSVLFLCVWNRMSSGPLFIPCYSNGLTLSLNLQMSPKKRVLSGLLISSPQSQIHQTIAIDQSGIILNTVFTLPTPCLASIPLM